MLASNRNIFSFVLKSVLQVVPAHTAPAGSARSHPGFCLAYIPKASCKIALWSLLLRFKHPRLCTTPGEGWFSLAVLTQRCCRSSIGLHSKKHHILCLAWAAWKMGWSICKWPLRLSEMPSRPQPLRWKGRLTASRTTCWWKPTKAQLTPLQVWHCETMPGQPCLHTLATYTSFK